MPRIDRPDYIDFTSWLPNWSSQAPKYTLPDGRQIYSRVKLVGIDPNDAVGRAGVSFLQNTVSDPAKQGLWIESKMLKGGTTGGDYPGETLAVQEWVDFAGRLPLVGFEQDEFQEGEWRIRSESAQYLAFKQKRADMYAAAGKVNNSYYCYGGFFIPPLIEFKVDGVLQDPTSDAFRKYYASQSAARQFAPAYFNLLLGKCWPEVKFYPEAPYVSAYCYALIAECEILMLGLGPGGRMDFVISDFIESLPGSTTAGNDTHGNCYAARRVASPAGTVLTGVHPQWDYELSCAMVFICGLVKGTTIGAWDNSSMRSSDPNTIYNAPPGDVAVAIWQPDVAGTPPPYPSNGDPGYPPERLTWYDFVLGGASHIYNEMSVTAGVAWQYIRYRVGNGEWVATLIDGSDILFAAKFKRGICQGRVKGSWVSFWYFNPSLPRGQFETVTVEIGGKQFTNDMEGSKLNPFNEPI